jgi:hypothetical protein
MIWVQTPKCVVCGEHGRLEVDAVGLQRFWAGAYVQDAFPDLDADQRELLITGTHAHCFETFYGGDDE